MIGDACVIEVCERMLDIPVQDTTEGGVLPSLRVASIAVAKTGY